METTAAKIERRGGRRVGAGRPSNRRRYISVWIKEEILDRLGSEAGPKIRELVEETFKDGNTIERHKQT